MKSSQKRADILGLNAKQLAQYKINQLGATGADAAAIHEKSRLIFLYEKEQEAIKKAAADKKKADKVAEAQAKADAKAAKQAQERREREDERREESLEKFVRNETAKREAKIAAAQENLTVIERGLMSERELLQSYESEELARITADRDAKLISLQEFETAKKQIEEKGANDAYSK